MSEQAGMPGELIYDHIVQIKQVTEYGVSLNPLLSGAAPPPAEGARFDIHVEGTATGPKLKGAVKGCGLHQPARRRSRCSQMEL